MFFPNLGLQLNILHKTSEMLDQNEGARIHSLWRWFHLEASVFFLLLCQRVSLAKLKLRR